MIKLCFFIILFLIFIIKKFIKLLIEFFNIKALK